MNSPAESISMLEVVIGMIAVVSFVTGILCIASLRAHVDETKIRKEESISALFRSPLPPDHVLTHAGVRRVRIAKVAIAVCFVAVAIIVVKVQILSR